MALPCKKETSVDQRQTILDLASASSNKIAKIMKISNKTVQRWKRKYEDTDNLNNKRCGGPCHTTRQDGSIIHSATHNPLTTVVKIKKETKVNVSARMIGRRLHKARLHHRILATKPLLMPTNRDERLGFALEYLPAEASFWGRWSSVTTKPLLLTTMANYTAGVTTILGEW